MDIKEIVVVEGREDARRLKEIYGKIDVITTNGSEINKETLEIIKKADLERGVIVFTDPDYPGKRIRSIIKEYVPGVKHAFINKVDGICERKNKVGIEHASEKVIRNALKNVMTPTLENKTDIENIDLIKLRLLGHKNSNKLREKVTQNLGIGHCNGKQLLNRLNMFNITKERLIKVVNIMEGEIV